MGFFTKRNVVPQPVSERGVETTPGAVSGEYKTRDNINTQGGELGLSAIYCAMEVISNAIAEMPILYKTTNNAVEFERKYDLGFQNTFMFIKSIMTDLLLHGNAFVYLQRNQKAKIVGMRYVPANRVSIYYDEKKNTLHYRCDIICRGIIQPQDMLHFLKNSRDGITGVGILALAQRTIKLANSTENSAVDYYTGGLNYNGMIHAKSPMTQRQAQDAVKSVEGNIELGKGKVIKFIPFDLDFTPLSTTAKDAALTETRLFNIQEVARYFNISPILLQDLSHGNYGSVEVANLLFLTQTLMPYIYLIEAEMTKKLVSNSKDYIDFDETALLRTDLSSTANYYTSLVQNGIMTVNETRIKLGLEPVEGGDSLHIAYSDLEQNTIGNQEEPEESQSNDKDIDKGIDKDLENNEDK